MKHQQVVPDYVAMVKASGTCLCLVFSGWVLFKLVQAIFWLPGYLEKHQGRLYEQVEQRSGISLDTVTEKEPAAGENKGSSAEDDRNREDRSAESAEEKGENDASECEADSKKDK